MSNESASTSKTEVATDVLDVKKEAARKWRAENSSHLKLYHRKYYSEHKDRIKAAIKEAKEKRDVNVPPKKRGRPRIPIPAEFGFSEETTN